jgi:hypothetical protein
MKEKLNVIQFNRKGMSMNDYFKEIANMKFTIANMDEIIQEREIVEKMINYLHSHV